MTEELSREPALGSSPVSVSAIDAAVRAVRLRTMTSIWMGIATVHAELDSGRLELFGDVTRARSMQQWLGLSPFAKEKRRAA